MVSLDYSLGIQIVNFLLLIFILNLLLYKPLLGMIDRRKRQLEESESEIKRLGQGIEQKMAAYEEKLRQAKAVAVEEKNAMIAQGVTEAKAIMEGARAEIPKIMEDFRFKMAEDVAAASRTLTDQSGKLSVEIAEKILGRSLQ